MKHSLVSMAKRPATAGLAALAVAGWLASQSVTAKVDPGPAPKDDKARAVLAVTAEPVRPMSVASTLAVNGSVAAWQEASVGAEVEGLRLMDVRANVGDQVRKGQLLAVFDTSVPAAELEQARAAMAEAQAQANEAQANARRARDLMDSGAMSHQQIQQYLAQDEAAQARLRAQKAMVQLKQVRLQKAQLLAPDDGVISARTVAPGAVTLPSQELFRLIRQGRLEWRAEVPADQLGAIQPGGEVRLWTGRGEPVDAHVRMVAPTVDTRTRTGLVYVDIPHAPAAAAFKAGMFVRGEFTLASHTGLTVPAKAVVVRDGFSYVYTVGADQRAHRLRVQTGAVIGPRMDARIEVASGLDPQARVIASGVGFLNDGDVVKVVARAAQPAIQTE